jgi:hypothetical protein
VAEPTEKGLPETRAGTSAEYLKQQKIGALFEEALIFLRATARTNDYFVGYSLAEVVQERIERIGKLESDELTTEFVDPTKGIRTLIGRLNHLKTVMVGEDEESGLIGEVLKSKSLLDLEFPKDGEGGP